MHRIRSHRGIMAVMVLTWLPYISVRCIEGATSGCPLVSEQHEAGQPRHQGHHYAPQHGHDEGDDHGTAAHHDHDGSSVPERTCCELTGKYAVEVTSQAPTASPVMAVAVIETADVLPLAARVARVRRVTDPTRHPPPYIRFATLLI